MQRRCRPADHRISFVPYSGGGDSVLRCSGSDPVYPVTDQEPELMD